MTIGRFPSERRGLTTLKLRLHQIWYTGTGRRHNHLQVPKFFVDRCKDVDCAGDRKSPIVPLTKPVAAVEPVSFVMSVQKLLNFYSV